VRGTNDLEQCMRYLPLSPAAKADWFIPAGLLALSFVPIAAGAFRIAQLGTGAAITAENARFFADPLPVVLHLVCAVIFCGLGAFQFSPGFRRRRLAWHRVAGWLLIPCGLVAAVTAVSMTLSYPRAVEPPASFDGPVVDVLRLLAGSAMALYLCLGLAAVVRRDIPSHRAWMMRAYALGLGAGTQVLTHLPWYLFAGSRGELARAVFMAAGWLINLAVAEWAIWRGRRRPSPVMPAP
jgi:hypothetical protein